jgi:hypothetical protein
LQVHPFSASGADRVFDKCRLVAPSGQDDFLGKNRFQGQFTGKIGSLSRKIEWTSGEMTQEGTGVIVEIGAAAAGWGGCRTQLARPLTLYKAGRE